MPAPEQEILLTASQMTLNIRLEPAQNVFHSLLLLAKPDKASGYSDWITETLRSMSANERLRHQVVMIGLFFAVKPTQSWSSFPEYIDHLDQLSPLALRDKLLYAYTDLPCLPDHRDNVLQESKVIVEDALETVDAFLDFLEERFPPEHIDRSLESKAYAYIIDPPALKSLVINHFRSMWEKYMEAEWMRVKPMLQDAVAAFEQVDYTTMDRQQATEFITGQ